MSYFQEPFDYTLNKIRVKLDLANYATKSDLKRETCDTSEFAKKNDLAGLKSDVDELNIDKFKTVPVDLSKQSNEVDNVMKTEYDKLVNKVNIIHTSGFVLKTQYNTDKSGFEKKINDADKKVPDTSVLVKKTDHVRINET